jgi:hypothetical protein
MFLASAIRRVATLITAAFVFGCSARTEQRDEAKQKHAGVTKVNLNAAREEPPSKKTTAVTDEATDELPGKSPVRVRVRMEQSVWGEWETVKFDYWIENSSDGAIKFRDGDKGRGFAGKLLRVRDAQGRAFSWGDKYVDPKKYPPTFGPVVQASVRGETVSEQNGMPIKDFIGPHGVGEYTLQVIVPAGRLMVNTTPTTELASGLLSFRIVALSDAIRHAINDYPRDAAGVTFEARSQQAKWGVHQVDLVLTNGSQVPISYSGYIDDPTAAMYRWEVLNGSGRWCGKESIGWCGTGMTSRRLEPGQSATISAIASEAPSRIVRCIVRVYDVGTKMSREIVSPGIEIVTEKNVQEKNPPAPAPPK